MIVIVIYSLILLCVGLAYNAKKGFRKERFRQCILCFILLFSFFGFRGLSVLNDTAHYYEWFDQCIHTPEFIKESIFHIDIYERFEPGFVAVFRFIAKYIWADPYAIILISSLWMTLGIILFTGKFTGRIGLVVFFLWCGSIDNYYSAIRQGLSMVIFFAAYKFLEEKKLIKYYVFAVVAFMCHRAGLILLFLPFIVYKEINKKTLAYLILASSIIIYFLHPILILLDQAESHYLDPTRERETFPVAHLIYVLINLFTIFYCYIISKNNRIHKPNDMFLWMLIINVTIGFISLPLGILGRYSMYFGIFTCIYLVYVYESLMTSGNRIKISKARAMLLLFVVLNGSKRLLQVLLKNEWNHLVPYSFYDFFSVTHQTDFGY